MQCEEIMKRNPNCISEQDSVQKAAQRMREENIGFLPVCDQQGRPLGTITDRDLAVRVLAQNRNAATKVGECMSREVIACKASDDLDRVEQLMAQHKKSRMMIIDGTGKLVGVISLSDIAQTDAPNAIKTLTQISQREIRA